MSLPKAKQHEAIVGLEEDLPAAPAETLVPMEDAQATLEMTASLDTTAKPPSEPLLTASTPKVKLPPLKKNWKEWPRGMTEKQATELSRRLLQCETTLGLVASVHLEKVSVRTGEHADVGRNIYSWIFESHHIVMGDMNCTWGSMIGGARLDYGSAASKPKPGLSGQTQEAWVKPVTHASATRKGGTYLPGITVEKVRRWQGDKVTIDPPAFDIVVVSRPMQVAALAKQPGKSFQATKLPRKQMQTLGWPSDHTSVVAQVKIPGSPQMMTVATWNVADPFYHSRFWPDADFGFDLEKEDSRLVSIERHVEELLGMADVIGLQEVPSDLVKRLVLKGMQHSFDIQWLCTPSDKDEEWYVVAVGRRGHSSEGLPTLLPPTAHDMMFCRQSVAARSDLLQATPSGGPSYS